MAADVMGLKMKAEKNTLVLLSSKRTKADARTRADEAFALPNFTEIAPVFQKELSPRICKEVAMERRSEIDVEILKQTMLQHEAIFREQVRELHRLYQVQVLLMDESRKKDSNVLTYSVPPSSNKSFTSTFSSSAFGPTREVINVRDATRLSSNKSWQVHTDFATNLEKLSPFYAELAAKKLPQEIGSPEKLIISQPRKSTHRTFDLERPAEEYMDDEAQDKSMEESVSLKRAFEQSVSETRFRATNLSSEPRIEVHSILGRGWERQDICKEETDASEENCSQNIFSLKRPRYTEEMSFFPLAPMRTETISQKASISQPSSTSTKRLEGELLGLNPEGEEPVILMSEWQRKDVDEDEGRRRRKDGGQPLTIEAGERSIQDNSKQPHWLLQGSITAAKLSAGNPLSQISTSHQSKSSTFLMQKQDKYDASYSFFTPEKNGKAVLFQEQLTPNNACSEVVGWRPDPVFHLGPQGSPPSGIPPRGVSDQGSYKSSQQVGETTIASVLINSSSSAGSSNLQPLDGTPLHNYPSVSVLPALIGPPICDSPAAPLQTLLIPGVSRGNPSVSMHDFPPKQSYQQNGFSRLMQQQQGIVNQPEISSSAGQGPCQIPVLIGVVGMQQLPTGICKSRATHPPGLMVGSTFDRNYHSFPWFSGVSTANFPSETSRKRVPAITPANVELTLAPFFNKLTGVGNLSNHDSPCMPQVSPQKEKGKSLGASYSKEDYNQKLQRREIFSEASNIQSLGGSSNSDQMVVLKVSRTSMNTGHERQVFNVGHEREARTTEIASSDHHLQILLVGSEKQETAAGGPEKREILSTGELNVKIEIPGQPDSPKDLSMPASCQLLNHRGQVSQKATQETSENLKHEQNEIFRKREMVQCSNERENLERLVDIASCDPFRLKDSGRTEGVDDLKDKSNMVVAKVHESRDSSFCRSFQDAPKSVYFKGIEVCQSQESGLDKSQGVDLSFEVGEKVPRVEDIASLSDELYVAVNMQQEKHCNFKTNPEVPCSISLPAPHSDALNIAITGHHTLVRESSSFDLADESMGFSDDVLDCTNEAAGILLSLASEKSCMHKREDGEGQGACTPERSSELLADIIPSGESGVSALVRAAADLIQLPEINGDQSSRSHKTCTCREDTVPYIQPEIEDEEWRSKEIRPPEELDFFESVTLMLEASGLGTSSESDSQLAEQREEVVEGSSCPSRNRRSSRRRQGMEFQREMLPSLSPLSGQKLTEDLQAIGGLMRFSKEVIMKSANLLSFKGRPLLPTVKQSRRNAGRIRGCHGNELKNACLDKEEGGSVNDLPQVISWGDFTRRRGMRRHRSWLSIFPPGIRKFSV